MRGKPFEPGNQMGRGRPRGSKNKTTMWREALATHGESILKQCMVKALKGDAAAQKLCLERMMPPCKPSQPGFRLPRVATLADLPKAWDVIARQMARGRLTPHHCQAWGGLVGGSTEANRSTVPRRGLRRQDIHQENHRRSHRGDLIADLREGRNRRCGGAVKSRESTDRSGPRMVDPPRFLT